MSEQKVEKKPDTEPTTAPEEKPQEAPPAEVTPPTAPEPEKCSFDAQGTFANGKGVMTAKNGCLDLERLQVLLVEQNGRTYEFSRISVR